MKKNNHHFIFYISRFFLVCFIYISLFSVAHAAVFSSTTETNTIGVDQKIEVTFFINTQRETVNTVSGSVAYNPAVLEVMDIYTGNSLVTFWITPPHRTDTQTIYFEGITPGGLLIDKGYLFSIIFKAKDIGTSTINISDSKVFLHDGLGTITSSTSVSTDIVVTANASLDTSFETLQDTDAPNKFTIVRSSSESVFDGRWFLTFTSQDKGVGIKYYTVCESIFKKCVESASPHELSNQSPWYWISVKAIDYNNNVRTAYLVSPSILFSFATVILLCILYRVYVYIRTKKRK